jgi:hypothetical protein
MYLFSGTKFDAIVGTSHEGNKHIGCGMDVPFKNLIGLIEPKLILFIGICVIFVTQRTLTPKPALDGIDGRFDFLGNCFMCFALILESYGFLALSVFCVDLFCHFSVI